MPVCSSPTCRQICLIFFWLLLIWFYLFLLFFGWHQIGCLKYVEVPGDILSTRKDSLFPFSSRWNEYRDCALSLITLFQLWTDLGQAGSAVVVYIGFAPVARMCSFRDFNASLAHHCLFSTKRTFEHSTFQRNLLFSLLPLSILNFG